MTHDKFLPSACATASSSFLASVGSGAVPCKGSLGASFTGSGSGSGSGLNFDKDRLFIIYFSEKCSRVFGIHGEKRKEIDP